MKMGIIIIIVGISMFAIGLVMFYSIELGQKDSVLRLVKNIGTFIGLSGMGVTLAGILLYLINRNEPQLKENYDV
jgi:NADH:ubiquinone oxidoreductase subunit 6 (subunit J)